MQGRDRGRDFVDRVGILFDEVSHYAHPLVKAALHQRHLLLQLLHLGLEFDDFLVYAPGRHHIQAERRQQTEHPKKSL